MSCKALGRLVVEASKHLKFVIVVVQSHSLLGYYLLVNLIDQTSDDNHSWNKMMFVELKHKKYCCKQTLLAASMLSSCLADS